MTISSTKSKNTKQKFQVGELFAGVGGIGLGFKDAGFDVVWANEIDANACQTYSKNFSHLVINEDMQKVDPAKLPKTDILTGGFPCQAFSVAGYRKGFKDDRGNLFFDIIRFIKALKPRVVFLENVKNLAAHDHGNTFKIIQKELQDAGYMIKAQVLNTAQYSEVPQNRERIYIVCFKKKKDYENFKFPKKIDNPRPITDFIEKTVDDKFYYTHTKYYPELKREITNPKTVYQWRRQYVRENKSNLCPTLTANMGMGGHNVPLVKDNKDIRKLTPRECARFQGFPDSFILPNDLPMSALYKQMGNSVSVPVIKAIAKNILVALKATDGE
ncbi:MAG: DNA cytosine methyltransferase [Alphaproteobacteria bacterium]|nr:DNA cytosine methyltransferase [Alphaproteobacteria bacterium]